MLNEVLRILFRFVFLVLLQVTVLNNIHLGGFINPYLYILLILLLPVRVPKNLLLLVAFLLGLSVDIFSNTLGMHAAATVFMAYLRPGILQLIAPREGYEAEAAPTIRDFGFKWFLVYSIMMILVHHTLLFFLEVFRFSEFLSTMFRVISSSAMTLLLIMISQYLFGKTKVER